MSETRTVIVTGGSSGIGLATAQLFATDGWNVVISGRDATRLELARASIGRRGAVATVVGDLADPDVGDRVVEAARRAFGGVDALVNNAGSFGASRFVDVSDEQLRWFVDRNLIGTFRVTQAVVRRMIEQGRGGVIVSVGTVLVEHSLSGIPASAALVSKGGLHTLTVALASELGAAGIRVNMVAPGMIRTPLAGPDVDSLDHLAVVGRVGEAAEVAEAVRYLAGATYVTGHVLNVDGGFVTARTGR